MNKNDFINIRIIKLEAEKASILSLISEYLDNDPEYPSIMLTSRIDEINNQIQALSNAIEMI